MRVRRLDPRTLWRAPVGAAPVARVVVAGRNDEPPTCQWSGTSVNPRGSSRAGLAWCHARTRRRSSRTGENGWNPRGSCRSQKAQRRTASSSFMGRDATGRGSPASSRKKMGPLEDARRPTDPHSIPAGTTHLVALRCGRHDWRAKVTTNVRRDTSEIRHHSSCCVCSRAVRMHGRHGRHIDRAAFGGRGFARCSLRRAGGGARIAY